MKDKIKLKEFPVLKSDKEAEEFVENSDLSDYDFSGFEQVNFEFNKKATSINIKLPEDLLENIKVLAKEQGISYTSFIKEVLERKVATTHI